MPLDTPLFKEKYEAISRWQDRHGIVFESGQRMAEYDDGSEKVKPSSSSSIKPLGKTQFSTYPCQVSNQSTLSL